MNYCYTHKLENRLCEEENTLLLKDIIFLLYFILIELKKDSYIVDGGVF